LTQPVKRNDDHAAAVPATTNKFSQLLAATVLACLAPVHADEAGDKSLRGHVPKAGVFPPSGAGVHFDGDLVISDPINRRGGLRRGDGSSEPGRRRYFAMLPYGMVRYHGAPADLRDIPPDTHLHARLLLPPEGEEKTLPSPTDGKSKRNPNGQQSQHNHAILLEDDASFYSRQGRSWKVIGIEQGGGPAPRLKLSVKPAGAATVEGGINKPALFDIDEATRIWKDRQLVGRDRIAAGQEVQVNLTWGPFDSLATTDVWLDQASLDACREIQRQRHLRLIRSRFLPGWVDEVKNFDTGGGEVTVTLFGGMDPQLYQDLRGAKNLRMCDAAITLRTWGYHQEYAVQSETLGWKETENPPPGSSGRQVRMKVAQMLDGFRPGRVVRLKGPWPYVLLPHDEWLMEPENLERASKFNPP